MVVSRYHCFSFLDRKLRFEGVLMGGDYVEATLLPHAVDFNGDGLDEMYGLGKFSLFELYGALDQRVTEPNGGMFYPQIYHIRKHAQPKTSRSVGVDGERILLLETVPVENAKPVIAVCRPSYFAFFNGVNKKWSFQWTPPIAITAATLIRTGEKISALIATKDNIFWELRFNRSFSELVDFKSWNIPGDVAAITEIENEKGEALISTNKGLLLFSNGKFEKIVDGSWMNAVGYATVNDTDPPLRITAVDTSGLVKTFERKKP
jgi:hypothetical protein